VDSSEHWNRCHKCINPIGHSPMGGARNWPVDNGLDGGQSSSRRNYWRRDGLAIAAACAQRREWV